jgi:hypothetical protein
MAVKVTHKDWTYLRCSESVLGEEIGSELQKLGRVRKEKQAEKGGSKAGWGSPLFICLSLLACAVLL